MTDELQDFSGVVRLFPLPNLVLFPHVVQPLHIFEQRYREMTADALADNKLIAMALLQPGWDKDYEGRPPLYSVACVARIVADHKLEDGRYNLLLRGLARAVILEEQPPDRLYRLARVQVLAEREPPPQDMECRLRMQLRDSALAWLPQGPAIEQLRQLAQGDLSIGQLCDLIAYALPLPIDAKQALLEQQAITTRAEMLLGLLNQQPAPPPPAVTPSVRKYPQEFSTN
jgi:Lon protease-like protein